MPYPAYDQNTERVALKRGLPEDDHCFALSFRNQPARNIQSTLPKQTKRVCLTCGLALRGGATQHLCHDDEPEFNQRLTL